MRCDTLKCEFARENRGGGLNKHRDQLMLQTEPFYGVDDHRKDLIVSSSIRVAKEMGRPRRPFTHPKNDQSKKSETQ